jgi:NADP-dependent 3-hydroxy acid dehydrogenase YdfG
MARLLASYSTNIAILDVSAGRAERVLSSLKTEFPSTRFLFKKCDISIWEEQKLVFEQIYDEVGSIDIVFANAGVSEFGKFLDIETEPTKPNLKTVDINLLGTLFSEVECC